MKVFLLIFGAFIVQIVVCNRKKENGWKEKLTNVKNSVGSFVGSTLMDVNSLVFPGMFQMRKKREYGVVINADGLSKIFDGGWDIKILDEGVYDMMSNSSIYVVSVASFVGVLSTGKTWVLNHIADEKDTGYNRTHRISAKFVNKQGGWTALIDSAGFDASIPFRKFGATEKDKVFFNQDRISIELLSLDFLVKSSYSIVVVVNELTFRDQQLLERIQTIFKEFEYYPDKRIFILHNFQNIRTDKGLKHKINEDILEVFGAKKREICTEFGKAKKGKKCDPKKIVEIYETFEERKIGIGEKEKTKKSVLFTHFVTGNGNAMRDFNEKTFRVLRTMLLTLPDNAYYRKIDVVEELRTFVEENLEKYASCEDGSKIEVKNEDYKKLVLSGCNDFEQKMITKDASGNIIFGLGVKDFKPQYDVVFNHKEGVGNILIDMPGEYEDIDCKVENFKKRGSSIVTFQGVRKPDNNDSGNIVPLFGDRKFGEFKIAIQLDKVVLIPSTFKNKAIVEDCACVMKKEDGMYEIEVYTSQGCTKHRRKKIQQQKAKAKQDKKALEELKKKEEQQKKEAEEMKRIQKLEAAERKEELKKREEEEKSYLKNIADLASGKKEIEEVVEEEKEEVVCVGEDSVQFDEDHEDEVEDEDEDEDDVDEDEDEDEDDVDEDMEEDEDEDEDEDEEDEDEDEDEDMDIYI